MTYAYFGLPLVPNVPFDNAPKGVKPLVYGSQAGAVIGAGMGLEDTLQQAEEEDMSTPKAIAKGALNTAAGATLGTLTGLSGGVLLNRAKGINNTTALNYANKHVFGADPQAAKNEALLKKGIAAASVPTAALGLSGLGLEAGGLAFGEKQIGNLNERVTGLMNNVEELRNHSGFAYMNRTANFMNLVKAGAGIGAVKGMLDQPASEYVADQEGMVYKRQYSPLERLTNIGINAAGGAALGLGAKRLKLDDATEVGRYMGKGQKYMDDQVANVKAKAQPLLDKIPEVEVRMQKPAEAPLPAELQNTINKANRRVR